jgi:hypothetical protein
MTTLATDNFNRANNADVGANWDTINTAMNISSNKVIYSSINADCGEVYNAVTWPDDQYSQVVLKTPQASGTNHGFGAICRGDAAANTCYRLIASGSGWEVDRVVSGVGTLITNSATPTFADGDVVRLELLGTRWTVKKNGAIFASGIDTNIATGKAGICYSSTDAAGGFLDDWEGGNLVDLGARTANFLAQPQLRGPM